MIDTKNPSKLYNPAVPYEIDQISIGGKRRPLNETKVVGLMESIRECGLINPITITIPKGARAVLVAGYHRLAACKRLGWKQIPTQVLHTQFPLLVELAEIDENLIRNELTPLEMADSLRRRKAIYEKLHPPAKKGGDHTSEAGKQNAESALSFAKDTAAKTGQSERRIQENVKLATDLTKGVKEKITGTPIAENKEELKALALVPKPQQAKVVEKVLSGQASSVRAAVEPKKQETKFGVKVCRERNCPELKRDPKWPDSPERCTVLNVMPGTLPLCAKEISAEQFMRHLSAVSEVTDPRRPGIRNCPDVCPYKQKKEKRCAYTGEQLSDMGLCKTRILNETDEKAGPEFWIDQVKTAMVRRQREPPSKGSCDYPLCCPDGIIRCGLSDSVCPVIRVPFVDLKECPLWRIPAKMLPAASAVIVQKNTFNATPQPGSIPVTEGPPQPSLAEQLKKPLPPLSPDADMKERLKRDEELLKWAKEGTEYDPFTGGKIIKGPPYKITKSKLLDSERDAMVDALLERTQFTPKDIEQIDELVKINREGWSCRYDVIEAAVMMLLAKAEGE